MVLYLFVSGVMIVGNVCSNTCVVGRVGLFFFCTVSVMFLFLKKNLSKEF